MTRKKGEKGPMTERAFSRCIFNQPSRKKSAKTERRFSRSIFTTSPTRGIGKKSAKMQGVNFAIRF
mgnify:CR=1 FL=1